MIRQHSESRRSNPHFFRVRRLSRALRPFSGKKRKNALFRPADDRLFAFYNDRALQQLLVLEQDLDHRFGIIDKIFRLEFQFLELGVLAHQVLDGILKAGND